MLLLDGPDAGRYLRAYDPDAREGRGEILVSETPEEALKFDSVMELWALWKTASTVHPIRLSDGKPNRPLTAYSITTVKRE
jgi:hypothetical protein